MRLAHAKAPRRGGFTLIELLVVIAIIALLVALTSAAVMKCLVKGPELRTRNDIQQLQASMDSYRTQVQIDYPPSMVRLGFMPTTPYYPNMSNPTADGGLDRDSIAYLKRLFPRAYDTWAQYGIVWNPNWVSGNTVNAPSPGIVLHGDQCLVFFLGGIPTTSNGARGCLGFSINPLDPGWTNPTNPNHFTFTASLGPWMTFSSSQLDGPYVDQAGGGGWSRSRNQNGFFVYNDFFDRPYAFFSSYKSRNGFNRYLNVLGSDCGVNDPHAAYLPKGAYNDGTTYYNPESLQIISAGKNALFGPGGVWTPGRAATIGPDGADDLCNFSPVLMGIAQ
jgi:prepilin-type N-terminal cleavage/methylation domain-containing protein